MERPSLASSTSSSSLLISYPLTFDVNAYGNWVGGVVGPT
jgi:hypothetical protein